MWYTTSRSHTGGSKAMATAEAIIQAICTEYLPDANERDRRKLAGIMAKAFGYGGTVLVSQYSKMSRNTIPIGLVNR